MTMNTVGMAISDEKMQDLLNVMAHFAMGDLDDVVTFSDKSEKEREDIIKSMLKACEVSAVVFSKLSNIENLDWKKISDINQSLRLQKFDDANELLNHEK